MPDDPGGAVVKQPESAHRERERVRLNGTAAWSQWAAGIPVARIDALRVFRVDQYTSSHNRLLKVRALTELFAGDADLEPFLVAMANLATMTESSGRSTR
jgi:hypothetical protein